MVGCERNGNRDVDGEDNQEEQDVVKRGEQRLASRSCDEPRLISLGSAFWKMPLTHSVTGNVPRRHFRGDAKEAQKTSAASPTHSTRRLTLEIDCSAQQPFTVLSIQNLCPDKRSEGLHVPCRHPLTVPASI